MKVAAGLCRISGMDPKKDRRLTRQLATFRRLVQVDVMSLEEFRGIGPVVPFVDAPGMNVRGVQAFKLH